jgi:hypothetical protein
MRTWIIAWVTAVSVMAGTAMADETGMTGAELTALLANGKTIKLGGPGEGYNGELTLNADGTGKGQAKTDGGDVLALTGKWRIEGDHFCPTWKEFNDGKEVCETWVPDGQNRVKVMLNGEKIGTNYW